MLNLGQAALDRLPTGHLGLALSQGLETGPWEPGGRVVSFWCVEGVRAAFLGETLGEQRLASVAHGREGERCPGGSTTGPRPGSGIWELVEGVAMRLAVSGIRSSGLNGVYYTTRKDS